VSPFEALLLTVVVALASTLGVLLLAVLATLPAAEQAAAEDPFFTDDEGRLTDSQHAVLAGVVYGFGGKI
jgi:hypothetical protein